ncbi:MAG: TonB-dependent receptor, partial [Elusimicrobiota bacterium]|nr:TonB-dependent receptor [Endomicrobiia bacterium]MDW8166072.1 TonB-dependent receptor [Elusimicrobiota bacterium]
GVVNIITKTFTQEKPQILTNISYGSFNTYSLNGSFDYVSLPFGIKISLADLHSDGWRDNSKYDALSGYADFGVEMLHGKLNFNVLSKKSKLGIPGVSLVPMESWDGAQEKEASTPYAVQHDEFNFICLSFENNFITSKISYDTQGLIYDNSKDPFWPEKTDSKLNTFNFSNNVRLPYKFYGTLSYNYTVINQQYPLNTSYNFKKDVSNLGIGLQKELTFGGMNFIPTVRWDSNSLFGNKFSPQVVFVYNFQRIKLSFTSGTSWRAPTFLDLYWPDQIWTKGNPNLKPEESYSFDFAVESNLGNISFLFNPFYRYIKDQIRWYPENPQDMFSAWVPSNVDEAIVQGIEFKTEFSFKNIFNNKVSFLLSDNRIKKKEEAHKGWQKQAYSPLFSLIYNLELLLPYSFKFISFLKYVDSQYSRDGELGRKLKEYILWDIKFTKEVFKFINIYFQINDLLDQKGVNREGYPQPGRTYEGGIYFTIKI